MWKRVRSLLRILTFRRDFESGMSEELRFHIDQYTEDLIASGVARDEAARRARIEFGNVGHVQEDCRQARRLDVFDGLVRELHHSVRLLRKSPGFTVTALLTLALCLGANLTLFAVLDTVLLRPLPFPDADRLISIYNTYPKAGVDRDGSSLTNYYERRGRIGAFASLALYRPSYGIVGEAGVTEREPVMRVTSDFFHTLGTSPALGRAFSREETDGSSNDVVILTHEVWRDRFQADPAVIGRGIRINDVKRTVIGVLPRGFRFLSSSARFYLPLTSRPEDRGPTQRHSGGNSTHMIARLNPGADIQQAQSEIDVHNATVEGGSPEARRMAVDAGFRTVVAFLQSDHVASIRPTLLLLQAGVLALLLIGVVNITNLLLIRANGRLKELMVRQALGAGVGHMIREVMVETTTLTLLGGGLGLMVAAFGILAVTVAGANWLPSGTEVVLDVRLGIAALAAAVLTGITLAVPITWFNLRRSTALSLQAEGRASTAGRAAQTLRHGFVVAQIAVAFVLLSGTGLLGLSLKHALAASPGFRSERVLTGQITLPWSRYSTPAMRTGFTRQLLDGLSSHPGVVLAAAASNVPFSGNNGKSAATPMGFVLRSGESLRGHYSYWVEGSYFESLGYTLRQGRFLTSADSQRPERVCVVDEDFARHYWPGTNPLGRRLFHGGSQGPEREAFTIVGVVAGVKQGGVADPSPGAVYYPYAYRADDSFFVVLRTALAPEALASTLRESVRKLDPDLPVSDLRSMDARLADSLVGRRSPALLAGLFSVIALLLTAIGTYGVLSYAVAQRRREIGLRMALGARPEQIRAQFLSLAGRLLLAGTTLGFAGAWFTGGALQSLLFQVPATHIATFAGTAGVLGVVSLFACLIPSFRAARISPIQALNE